jgi:hypothetical protein
MTDNNQFYSVTANLPEGAIEEYVRWLRESHLREMILAGALEARMVVYPAMPDRTRDVETQYLFPNEVAFRVYEEQHAPRLRAEGMRLFGSIPGVRFTRRLGMLRTWK